MNYFITAIAYYPDDKEKRYDQPYKCTRTFGHFPTIERAQEAVNINEGGLDECLYNYIVIEEVAYGIYGRIIAADLDDRDKGEWWYQWEHPDGQMGHWVPMAKPDWSNGIIGWSI